MLDASQKAMRFVEGQSRDDLENDEQLALAIVRLIEIIGEAAAKVSVETRERYSAIPWKDIVDTRNRMIHGYDEVDLDIVWQILTNDLPPLAAQLRAIIDKEEQSDEER
jgi:uncharacterized protein with HEPN domain